MEHAYGLEACSPVLLVGVNIQLKNSRCSLLYMHTYIQYVHVYVCIHAYTCTYKRIHIHVYTYLHV